MFAASRDTPTDRFPACADGMSPLARATAHLRRHYVSIGADGRACRPWCDATGWRVDRSVAGKPKIE
ncbi:hypothetical protein [Chloroflexus sp.]|uniref:hypothetical protein n=1 Tax=Chloroflexus sp. TaxID=1904827 RepID=UPI0026117EFD|nr:hypothetical protein [uncultured Chloroflexus sp.]